jgi:hypothetical protein
MSDNSVVDKSYYFVIYDYSTDVVIVIHDSFKYDSNYDNSDNSDNSSVNNSDNSDNSDNSVVDKSDNSNNSDNSTD